jgi:hypothetical protein
VPTGVESGVTAPDIKSTKLGRAGAPAYSGRAHRPPSTGGPMTAITLDQADRLIDAILNRGAELD